MFNRIKPANLSLSDLAENSEKQVDFSPTSQQASNPVPASMPAVEVIEVNDDAAWALWEDSVAFQDSQFSDEAMFQSTAPMPLDAPEVAAGFVEPFASVHKKSS